LKKKIIIAVGAVLSAFILTYIIFIFLFPVLIINGKEYSKNNLKKTSKQRELAYDNLNASLNNEIENTIYNLYIKPLENKIADINEKYIIYYGDISLLDKINKNNLLRLTKEELRILRNTIYAKYGYIFQSKELSKHFNRFLWYNPQFTNVDNKLSEFDKNIIELIREIENEQINNDIQSILEKFYYESINIENNCHQLITECNNKFSFPLQNKKACALNEIFPEKIHVINYNNQFYNEYALKLLMEQYENIIRKIIEVKTKDIIEYIEFYSFNQKIELLTLTEFIGHKYFYEIINGNFFDYYINQCLITNTIIDKINSLNVNLTDDSFLNIPVIMIDDVYYDSTAVNELQKSMEIASSQILRNIKNILTEGVNYQTEIFSKNIDDYVKWYYSSITRIDKTATQIIGFLFGSSVTDEAFFIDNFNRIINKDANFDNIVINDIENQVEIIISLFNEYLYITDFFKINSNQATQKNKLTEDDYIEPYRGDIISYFEQIFVTLNAQKNFNIQDFTIKDNKAVKATKTSIKLLPGVSFLGGILVDYAALKTQKLLNSSELKQHIYEKMTEGQKNKIAIIEDPYNFSFEALKIGSILFVDNYFVGLNAYQHYGVYIGNKKVIHFAPLEGQEISMKNGIIHETTLEKFLNGRALQIDTQNEKKFSDNEIINRARSRLGEKGYDLVINNCEHFARWCVTGEHVSYQVNNFPEKANDAILTAKENLDRAKKFVEFIDLFF
jgi:hypothetical protein